MRDDVKRLSDMVTSSFSEAKAKGTKFERLLFKRGVFMIRDALPPFPNILQTGRIDMLVGVSVFCCREGYCGPV